MNLSSDQITKIQSSFSHSSIFYDDIREELVDHFATEIEEKMDGSTSFDILLQEKLNGFDQKKFQRTLLLQSHVGMLKAIFKKMLSFWLLVKVIIMTYVLGVFINAFNDYSAEQLLKISFITAFIAVAFLGLIRTRLLKNFQIVAAGNSLFMLGMISQFVLRLEWLQWTGLSNTFLLFALTFWFCLLLVAGFRVLSGTVKRVQLA